MSLQYQEMIIHCHKILVQFIDIGQQCIDIAVYPVSVPFYAINQTGPSRAPSLKVPIRNVYKHIY